MKAKDYVDAAAGRKALSIKIKNVKVVNVFNDTIETGDIGILDDRIVCIGNLEEHPAATVIDGKGKYALPGFIDVHMHVESSMLTPANFSRVVLENGTTSCCADPHEIANVCGMAGIQAMIDASRELPLHIYYTAPSTIPSAPGYETSGFAVGAEEMEKMLKLGDIRFLGEVMDFNGVANGEEHILSVIDTAAAHNVVLDGHVPVLSGFPLQAFRASGVDSDHCINTPEKLCEDIALGIAAEVQGNNMTPEIVQAMNEAKVNNRIMICTDDVSLTVLLHHGQLNYAVEKAISMGLDPLKAIRFATINAADRMRLYDTGAVAPGRIADIQLVADIRHPKAEMVFSAGKLVVKEGKYCGEHIINSFPDELCHSVHLGHLNESDFAAIIAADEDRNGTAEVNVMQISGNVFATKRVKREMSFKSLGNGKAILDYTGYVKQMTFNRHGGNTSAFGFIEGMGRIHGAVAVTYSHDSHNLSVYGSNDNDMAIAANAVIDVQGGFAAVVDGELKCVVPLPIAGLLTPESPEAMMEASDRFCAACLDMGFETEKNPLHFFTFMPLAVCADIRCTDMGMIDVVNKKHLPLVEKLTY